VERPSVVDIFTDPVRLALPCTPGQPADVHASSPLLDIAAISLLASQAGAKWPDTITMIRMQVHDETCLEPAM
jgi:hypothetical protein